MKLWTVERAEHWNALSLCCYGNKSYFA